MIIFVFLTVVKTQFTAECLKVLKSRGNLEAEETEHLRYIGDLNIIGKCYPESSEIGRKVLKWKQDFKNNKNSDQINNFWDLQVKKYNIEMEIKLFEGRSKLLEKQRTQHILDTTREVRNQSILLQEEVTKKIENRVTGRKRAREEKTNQPSKKRTSSGKKVGIQLKFLSARKHIYGNKLISVREILLPDGNKVEKATPLNLLPSDDDDSPDDKEHSELDNDEDIPAPEETLNSVLNASKSWILPSGKKVQRPNRYTALWAHGNRCDSEDLLLHHRGVEQGSCSVDVGEWEFAVNATGSMAISDRCRLARINQSILNGLLNCNLNDEQVKKVNVLFRI
ncbi:hypothetical protein C1645_740372 [Glomus cerebriforme]|uniref:Uncharacterized protein n=1 Tax=Glomus cerebriforme TaxID=658196 RepID=A0A397SW39_9GLOM|nr:hypothetical protein C1645_740372 [Glomus cerebriforme]